MNLTQYMNDQIEFMIKSALKAAFKNPREAAFITKASISQKRAAAKREQKERQGVHIPPFLIASIASRCNLRCAGCYARANKVCGDTESQNELPAYAWEKVFSEASELGISFILLAGGEPLLRPDLLGIAAGFSDIIFPVFTNGTVFDAVEELFNKSRNLIPIISIEGTRQLTDARRGTGTFDIILSSMDRLKKRGILFGASITATKQNLETITDDSFIELLQGNGCGVVFYVEYVPFDEATSDIAFGEAERLKLSRRIDELRIKYEGILFLSFPGDETETGGCLAAGRGFFHINPAGDAEPCPFSPYSDRSIRDYSLLEIMQSPLFKGIESTALLNVEHSGGCALFAQKELIEKLTRSSDSSCN